MIRKAMMAVACLVMAGTSARAATLPVTLFEDNATQEFGQPGSLDGTNPFSGSFDWAVDYADAFSTHGFNMNDGQASINDIVNNDVSVWYRTDTAGDARFNIGTFDNDSFAVVTLTDTVEFSLIGDNQWHQLLIDFSDGGSGLDPTVDRNLRLRPRNWEASERTVHYDLVVVTPEPASLALLGLGGLVMLRRRR